MGKKIRTERTVRFGGKLMFRGDYLSAAELEGNDLDLTIKEICEKDVEFEEGEDVKATWIVSFEETPRQLTLNTTNAETIGQLHGVEATEWIGKRITLYPAKVKAWGEMVDAIRVRDEVPATVEAETKKKKNTASYKK